MKQISVVKSVAQLMHEIKKKTEAALKDEVFNTVAYIELKNIHDTVYMAYTPCIYDRRWAAGGMLDPRNIMGEITSLTLSVVNITPPNTSYRGTDKNLPQLIEYGHGYRGYYYDYPYDTHKPPTFLNSRPFTGATINELQESKAHVKALKQGLRDRGIKLQ